MGKCDELEMYTIVLYHENSVDGIQTPIEKPVMCHVTLHPLFKKTADYSVKYLLAELANKLCDLINSEE